MLLAVYFLFPQEKPEAIPAASFDLIEAESPQQTEPPPSTELIPENFMVDIKGQVVSPGVYELSSGARIQDAIRAAGGFLPAADDRAINLAMKIQDELIIYVPKTGEEIALPSSPSPTGTGASGAGAVDINTATEAELVTLPGIGPSKAAAIISYRTENGKFKSVEDLKEVAGIGDKTFEQLKDGIIAK